MSDYYMSEDLKRMGEIGKYKPEAFKKFMDWYSASLEPGALTRREKLLIAVAVAHVTQCPYCIDAGTKYCYQEGMNLEHITEAVHVAAALRAGASIIHSIQTHNAAAALNAGGK